MIGDLVREHLKARIDLTGLSDDEVGKFVAMTTGSTPSDAIISAIREDTAGNPFFVKECARLAIARQEGAAPAWGFGVPPNARDPERRLSRYARGRRRHWQTVRTRVTAPRSRAGLRDAARRAR
jgi:hypothetical protein